MQKISIISAAIAYFLGAVSSLEAQTVDGWCFEPDPCMGVIEIENGRFQTCEQSCQLEPRYHLTGDNAQLNILSCASDGAPQYTGQAVFVEVDDAIAFLIDDLGTHPLQYCAKHNSAAHQGIHISNVDISMEHRMDLYAIARGVCRGLHPELDSLLGDHACEFREAQANALLEAGYTFDRSEQIWVPQLVSNTLDTSRPEIRAWTDFDQVCRGSSGDLMTTQLQCQARDAVLRGLAAQGYCYGQDGQTTLEYSFHRCSPNSVETSFAVDLCLYGTCISEQQLNGFMDEYGFRYANGIAELK